LRAQDWPGYGQSPAPSPAQIAKAAFLFFEVLREFVAVLNLPACIIIGNSVGGNAAVRLAHDRPERVARLVLVSPGGFTPHNVVTRNLCWFMSTRLAPSPSMFARIYLGHHGAPVVKAMLQRARTEQSHGPALALNRAVWGSFALPEHDVRGLARTLQLPVLLVFGKHDPVIPPSKDGAEARKSFGTNAKFVVMDSGHAPFAEIPAEFLKELDAFLQAA
jgi:pimeloyl-ACP methyl ester carboxylesterase